MATKKHTSKIEQTAIDCMGVAADGNVGFGHMKTIFECIAELSKSKPHLAARLADLAAYWADTIAYEFSQAQDTIEAAIEGGVA